MYCVWVVIFLFFLHFFLASFRSPVSMELVCLRTAGRLYNTLLLFITMRFGQFAINRHCCFIFLSSSISISASTAHTHELLLLFSSWIFEFRFAFFLSIQCNVVCETRSLGHMESLQLNSARAGLSSISSSLNTNNGFFMYHLCMSNGRNIRWFKYKCLHCMNLFRCASVCAEEEKNVAVAWYDHRLHKSL